MISLGKLRVYRLLSSVPSYRRERLWTKALLALSFLFLAFLLAFFLPSFSALPEIGIVFFSVFYLNEPLRWNYIVGFGLIVLAAWVIFKQW